MVLHEIEYSNELNPIEEQTEYTDYYQAYQNDAKRNESILEWTYIVTSIYVIILIIIFWFYFIS